MVNSFNLYGQYKKAPHVGKLNLSNELASHFMGRQFRFELDALGVVEVNVIANESLGLVESLDFLLVDTLGFEDAKEIFRYSNVIAIPTS